MTERQGSEVIEILRSRLGMQYHAGIDEGRREIARVLADELRLDGGEAETMVRRLIDSDTIRYVTADERDPVTNDEGRVDVQGGGTTAGDSPARRGDPLLGAAVGQGGPQAGTSGQLGGPVLPPAAGVGAGGPAATTGPGLGGAVTAAGSGGGSPGTLAVAAASVNEGGQHGGGYWDFGERGKGVVPSTTRKGQVEPKGT